MEPVRFILDVHLGKLARHLRMLGFDALWTAEGEDDVLLQTALTEKRRLLTRDRELHDRTPEELRLYVGEKDPADQLRGVLGRLGLIDAARSKLGFLTRCLECNQRILPMDRERASDFVPAQILEQHEKFYLCPRCERVYWEGSHFDRMREWVDRILKLRGVDSPP